VFHSVTIEINAPPQRVWAAVVDVERWPDFMPPFKRIERLDNGPLGHGKSARVTPNGFVSSVWTVREFEDGKRFLWDSNALPGLRFTGGHVVEPAGSGANATSTLETSGWLAALLGPLVNGTLRRNVDRELEGLKAYCEGN
jgi:carbon monoxide dehydrogenase subunit G